MQDFLKAVNDIFIVL